MTGRSGRHLCGTLATALALGCVMLIGWHLTWQTQARQFDDHADKAFHAAGVRIAELRSVMQSMLGMHYASDEFAGADIDAFARQLRFYSPFVRGLGMFEYVDGGVRANYEKFMSERLDRRFRIHGYDAAGRPHARSIQERYLPLISIDSGDPSSLALLGTDLAGNRRFADLLARTESSGEAFVMPLPGLWPLSGDTLLIQPAYFGERMPEDPRVRKEQFAGGIWLSIDLGEMLSFNAGAFDEIRLSMQVETDNQRLRLLDRSLAASAGTSLDVGYDLLESSRSWQLGESRLTLSVSSTPTMPLTHLLVCLLATAGVASCSALLMAFSHHRRLAQHERLRSLTAISKEREKAEKTLESISDSVISLNSEGRIIYMNTPASRFLRLSSEVVLQQHASAVLRFEPAVEGSGFSDLRTALSALAPDSRMDYDVTVDLPHLKGATITLTLTRMTESDELTSGSILVLRDVSQERKLTSELEFRANRDFLTGCFNRFYFDKRLAELVDDVRSSKRSHALCYIDLDQFKIVNDTCGHASGDRLLCEVSDQLRARLRSGDVLARLGGDEFGVIICDALPDAALAVANKLFEFFQSYVFEQDGKAFAVHASVGLVDIDEHRSDLADIMSAADIACYTAKDSGRNLLVVYSDDDASMNERKAEMNWLPLLKQALQHDRFRLLVQAVAALDSASSLAEGQHCIKHYEFLLRLQADDGELISPFKFIQAAERYDLMREIDRWVVDHAFRSVKQVLHLLDKECTFSINLSGQSAADPELLAWLESRLAHHQVEPSRFWFEITETAAISHFANAVALISGIGKLGAKVALDDFGSGLSSFGYLRKLPIDVLKIDGQFVRDIDTSDVACEMVRAIDSVGKAMGVKTVGEFVESEAVMRQLASIGVDYAQGYHIARPCELAEVFSEEEWRLAS